MSICTFSLGPNSGLSYQARATVVLRAILL